jgi:hypothetical protein
MQISALKNEFCAQILKHKANVSVLLLEMRVERVFHPLQADL